MGPRGGSLPVRPHRRASPPPPSHKPPPNQSPRPNARYGRAGAAVPALMRAPHDDPPGRGARSGADGPVVVRSVAVLLAVVRVSLTARPVPLTLRSVAVLAVVRTSVVARSGAVVAVRSFDCGGVANRPPPPPTSLRPLISPVNGPAPHKRLPKPTAQKPKIAVMSQTQAAKAALASSYPRLRLPGDPEEPAASRRSNHPVRQNSRSTQVHKTQKENPQMAHPTKANEHSSRNRRRNNRGLTTLEWLLIVAAVAGLAALAVVLVQNVVDETAEQISGGSARITAAQVAAQEITDDLVSGKITDASDGKAKCERLKITYNDAFSSTPTTWTAAYNNNSNNTDVKTHKCEVRQ